MLTMKRCISLLMVLCLVLSAIPITAYAEIIDSGTCGSDLTWTLDSDGLLTISGTGVMSDYFDCTAPWYSNRTEIESVCITDGVTSIGSSAFRECTSLTSITIPDGVTSIGDCTFMGCTSLTSIIIPDGVTSIGGSAFYYCTSLINITIPDGVTSIGGCAFMGCSNLTSITIPDGVTSIGDHAFFDCTSLTSITIPDSVTSIGYDAFNRCSSLTYITIPDSVTSIGDHAFASCSSLTSITIPEGVTSIGDGTFSGCTSLTGITIPDGVTNIGVSAFSECTRLTSIIIPDGVTSIGNYTFSNCSSLTSITIPDGVTSIGVAAFYYCGWLDVYYAGTQEEWENISIAYNNTSLIDENIHYNHVHDYSLLQSVTVAATCTQDGYIEYTCAYGETYREILPKLGHDFVASGATVAPTCTEQGYMEVICSRCGTQGQTDLVAALGHDYTGPEATVAPTCTEKGYSGNRCTRCNSIAQTNIIPALGHQMAVVLAVDPTCTETGLTLGTACERCGLVGVSQTEIPALGHDLGEWIVSKEATCTENGEEIRECSRCDHTETRYVDATGHSYTAIVTASTCTEQGYTTYTCSCGDSYVSDYVDAHGHDMGEWKTVTAPTCTEEGSESRCCSRCDHTETRSIDALGHSYTSTVTVPTCTERGYTIYTCKCGESYIADYMDALGHSFGDWTVIQKPTTTEEGLEERSCARCGHTEQRTVAKLENPFKDVKPSDFYYTPVLWALENNITSGTASDEFSPYDSCLRSQVVTFLWRAAGKPKTESTRNPFVDVKPTDYYYNAVLWAVEKGITSGADANHFEPNGVCNRSQVVTFLYRAFGKPPVGNVRNPFTDVSSGDWYASAVLWAVREGITSGLSTTKFGPNDACNRSQVVTFLYRAYN